MKKISIIVPVYNASNYIKRCLNSIINQTYENYEAIIIDDGSIDDSLSILNSYKKKDNRIKIYSKKNTGVSDTRNYGLNISTGDYITFVDIDDYLDCDILSKAISIFEKADVDIVSFNFNYVINGKNKKHKKYKCGIMNGKEALNPYLSNYYTSVWGKIYKKELLKDLTFNTDIYYSEDTLFYTNALLRSKSVFFSNEYMYYYVINKNSAMSNKNISKFKTDFIARKKINELYIKNKLSDKEIQFAKYYLIMSAVNIIFENNKKKSVNVIEETEYCKNNLNIRIILFTRLFKFKMKIKMLYVYYLIKRRRC